MGYTPVMLSRRQRDNIITYEFESDGVPLTEWENRKEGMENVLDMTISRIYIGDKSSHIIVTGCKGKFDEGTDLYWNDYYLEKENVFVLGEAIGFRVTVDLENIPHILIGGATGSGKTYLLKHIIYQAIKKNYEIYIADFKGGLDYPVSWKRLLDFITDIDEARDFLKKLCDVLDERKKELAASGCKDIDAYNKKYGEIYQHILFACDELAELLDCSGLSKEDKALRHEIIGYISTIARLGRAFGIHLVISTQRPDADIVPGQIKNNISYRICGRAEDTLSRIILDNTEAADRISSDARGIFVNQGKILFKGYLIPDKYW